MLNKVLEKNPKIPLLNRYRYHSGGIEVKLLWTARFRHRTVTVPALNYSRNNATHILFISKVKDFCSVYWQCFLKFPGVTQVICSDMLT